MTVLDSYGLLGGFAGDGLNLSKMGDLYHFVQNLPTLLACGGSGGHYDPFHPILMGYVGLFYSG